MTHRYTILVGGNVLSAPDQPVRTAIAWADDTVIGLGSDDEMRGLSRGDSRFVDLDGAWVVPLGEGDARWPVDATLELGGPADLAVLARDPRAAHPAMAGPQAALALIRGGRLVTGRLPGVGAAGHDDHGGEHEPADPD